jgi:hypothetical protein
MLFKTLCAPPITRETGQSWLDARANPVQCLRKRAGRAGDDSQRRDGPDELCAGAERNDHGEGADAASGGQAASGTTSFVVQ